MALVPTPEALPNFILSREYRVKEARKLLGETMESKNRQTINAIYDKWCSDPQTQRISS